MFSVTRLVETADETQRVRMLYQLQARARETGAGRALVQPTLPGVRNGGDTLVHLEFSSADARAEGIAAIDELLGDPAVQHYDGASYDGVPVAGADGTGTVYRTLLLRVRPDTDDMVVRRFEEDLRLLPRYVRTIHSWQLSRVEEAVGASPWTHVFEQEFTDLDGLMGPYLMHPVHWARVDRWFDPECPEVIVQGRICHSFCRNIEN
jgi:hypothetical protein